MKPSDMLPTLRAIEVVRLGEGDEETFLLRDPQQLSDQALTVSHPVLFCLQFFDGKTQVATLGQMWREAAGGEELPIQQVDGIVNELDRVFLLDNERSRERFEEVVREFAAAAVRPSRYNDDGMLDQCYQAAGLAHPSQIANESNDLALLVAPHIDYARGGAAWALAYGAARRRFSGDVALVLGVNHQPHSGPLALTRKDFDTPFGRVTTDKQLVDEIAAALPFDAFADEFTHRDEHSVELAVTALKHAFGEACPRIVPVLCGSLDDFVANDVPPTEAESLVAWHDALRAVLGREGDRVLTIASVDLAHIGPQFGFPQPITDGEMELSLVRDQQLVTQISNGDAQGLFDLLVAEKNRRNICGAAPLYHSLSVVEATRPLDDPSVHFWRAADNTGAVSFAVAGRLR